MKFSQFASEWGPMNKGTEAIHPPRIAEQENFIHELLNLRYTCGRTRWLEKTYLSHESVLKL